MNFGKTEVLIGFHYSTFAIFMLHLRELNMSNETCAMNATARVMVLTLFKITQLSQRKGNSIKLSQAGSEVSVCPARLL